MNPQDEKYFDTEIKKLKKNLKQAERYNPEKIADIQADLMELLCDRANQQFADFLEEGE